jgi:hypothetical protein
MVQIGCCRKPDQNLGLTLAFWQACSRCDLGIVDGDLGDRGTRNRDAVDVVVQGFGRFLGGDNSFDSRPQHRGEALVFREVRGPRFARHFAVKWLGLRSDHG